MAMSYMRHLAEADKRLEILGYVLRKIVRNDLWFDTRTPLPGALQHDLNLLLCHCFAKFRMRDDS